MIYCVLVFVGLGIALRLLARGFFGLGYLSAMQDGAAYVAALERAVVAATFAPAEKASENAT